MISKIWSVYSIVFKYRLNLWKSLFFNLKVFGIKGCKLPILLFGKIDIQNVSKGCIELDTYKPFQIKIGGGNTCYVHGSRPHYTSIINIKGKVEIGERVTLCNGIVLGVGKYGNLTLNNHVFLHEKSRIYCENKIVIGEYCRISWESQIFDTNFHYTVKDGIITPKNAPIEIGHHTWIGNRVTISKGVVLPAYSVVSANSFINKSFANIEERSLIGGVPAKYITTGIERMHDFSFEFWLDSYFKENHQEEEYGKLIELYNCQRDS